MNKTSTKRPLTYWLETASKLVALAIPTSFVCSIIYDYAFYGAYSLTFAGIPTSIMDHLRTSLVWFPFVFAVTCGLMVARFKRSVFDDDTNKTDKTEAPWPYMFFCFGLSIAFFVNYMLRGDTQALGLTVALFAFWCGLLTLLVIKEWLPRKTSALLIYIFLTVISTIYTYGRTNAMVSITDTQFSDIISLKNTGQLNCKIIRYFEKGVLVSDATSLTFLPWEDIHKIESKFDRQPFRGLLSAKEK